MRPKGRLRWVHGVLAVSWLANGVWMLFAPAHWFATLPGTEETGPLNAHLVRDFGTAFVLMGGFALLGLAQGWFDRRFHAWITLFFSLHAGIHAWELVAGQRPAALWLRDFPLVFFPVILLLLLALPGAWEKK